MNAFSIYYFERQDRSSVYPHLLVMLIAVMVYFVSSVGGIAQTPTGPVAQVTAQNLSGYGRIILDFDQRFDLPAHNVQIDNGVVAVVFDNPIEAQLPDLPALLPNFIGVARLDPDGRGIRLALKGDYPVNTMEAGERLFIDIMSPRWRGSPPPLPMDVVEELAERSRNAAQEAERRRLAEIVRDNPPTVTVKAGVHQTFVRLQFDWDRDTNAIFDENDPVSTLTFDWPMKIDLYPIVSTMPETIDYVRNRVDDAGSHVTIGVKDGAKPRFYATSRRQFIVDVDVPDAESDAVDISTLLPAAEQAGPSSDAANSEEGGPDLVAADDGVVRPHVETIGSTVRLIFPFARDTSAAVFTRGDSLWMLFDTTADIAEPRNKSELEGVADTFELISAGDTAVVRMKLASDRLATLGSEGRSWVLSLGDILLSATEPVGLTREPDREGKYSILANMERPGQVHQLRDPDVGDVLQVVTAFPPARGMVRAQKFVDFTAITTVHGLVVQPSNPDLNVSIENKLARISAPEGLTVSTAGNIHIASAVAAPEEREGYIDLLSYEERNRGKLRERREEIMSRAANSDRRVLDAARLELTRFYLANQLPYEAIGTVEVMLDGLSNTDLEKSAVLTKAAAEVAAGRSDEAIDLLDHEEYSEDVDALMWRSMAKFDTQEYTGAVLDAQIGEVVADSYPDWVRTKFLLSAAESAIETANAEQANHYLGSLDASRLDEEDVSRFELLSGRVDELAGRYDEALDTYGQVMADNIRPTHAAAVYQTIELLDKMGKLDPLKGAETLASEAMVWRGDKVEARMQALLSSLFLRTGEYREAFETIRNAALSHPEDPKIDTLLDDARYTFADLYLDGRADSMDPVEALTLYYDFQQLTPPGARGDEMIRNLARRLVRVDLLDQAAELLEYQVDNRLEGAARAQIAADLAIIYVADRKPAKAIEALQRTQFNGLPPSLERQRRILLSRSLIDAGRELLALDMLNSLDGRDADLLRVDAYWKAKRYREGAELLERIYAPNGSDAPLTRAGRSGIVKAAVGFILADDQLGLSRLRSKYSNLMADTPEWPVFSFVTGPVETDSREFRKVASDVAGIQSLNAFLDAYSQMYQGGGALTPAQVSAPDGNSA